MSENNPPAPDLVNEDKKNKEQKRDAGNDKDKDKDKGRNRSSGHNSTGSRRHKPKRAKAPCDFAEWTQEDQEKYKKTTIELRRWKAMRVQCYYVRRHLDHWINIKSMFSFSPIYKEELRRYEEIKQVFKPVPKNESLDIAPFHG